MRGKQGGAGSEVAAAGAAEAKPKAGRGGGHGTSVVLSSRLRLMVDYGVLRWAIAVAPNVIGSRRKIRVECAIFFNGYAFPMVTFVAQ